MRRSTRPILLLLCMAMPASAQFARRLPSTGGWRPVDPLAEDGRQPGPDAGRELRDIRRGIERRRDEGELTRREARGLKREARRIDRVADRYARGGLSGSERSHLQGLTLALRDQVGRPRPRPAKAPR